MNLDILIGDDLFAFPPAARIVKDTLGTLKEKLSEHQVTYAIESVPDVVIKAARTGKYHVVVTAWTMNGTGRARKGTTL